MDRRSALRAAVVAGVVTGGVLPGAAPAAAKKPKPTPPRDIVFRRWRGADFGTGEFAGSALVGDGLRLTTPIGQLPYTDPHTGTTATFDYATWTSAAVPVGFAATEAIPSWNAATPGATWVQVELQGTTEAGTTTKWYNLGRWAADDGTIKRTSVPAQGDTDGTVLIDTFAAVEGRGWTAYRVRVTLLRPAGGADSPELRLLGVAASAVPATDPVASPPQSAQGVVLPVPQYSQNIHAGEYPQWDGGGEAWCSPTSTSMVVAHWGTGPTPADYAWVDPSYADPWVDHAARNVFDYNYDGAGNWPFNTAYAGRYGLDGFVTRLRSLVEAERFIAAGIPLVLSISFKKNEVPGLTYSTNGHLLVVVGFTADGQPVLNDPAASEDAAVRKIAGRAEFEAAWLRASGGVVYVIHPASTPLPAPPSQANW